MTELEGDEATCSGRANPPLERFDDAGPGAPRDVEARHRVAMTGRGVAAALRPADDWENAMSHGVQPGAFLPASEVDVCLRPLARPVVLLAVECRGAQPVLPGELTAVLDAQPSLLG